MKRNHFRNGVYKILIIKGKLKNRGETEQERVNPRWLKERYVKKCEEILIWVEDAFLGVVCFQIS